MKRKTFRIELHGGLASEASAAVAAQLVAACGFEVCSFAVRARPRSRLLPLPAPAQRMHMCVSIHLYVYIYIYI